MLDMSTTSPFLFAVVVALIVVALLPRLRRVSLEALRIGPVSFGPICFSFESKRSRAALLPAGPARLPSRSSKRSRPRTERRTAKNGTHSK
jgi:hypothetical protein